MQNILEVILTDASNTFRVLWVVTPAHSDSPFDMKILLLQWVSKRIPKMKVYLNIVCYVQY